MFSENCVSSPYWLDSRLIGLGTWTLIDAIGGQNSKRMGSGRGGMVWEKKRAVFGGFHIIS
jgi:hypothetical protein